MCVQVIEPRTRDFMRIEFQIQFRQTHTTTARRTALLLSAHSITWMDGNRIWFKGEFERKIHYLCESVFRSIHHCELSMNFARALRNQSGGKGGGRGGTAMHIEPRSCFTHAAD